MAIFTWKLNFYSTKMVSFNKNFKNRLFCTKFFFYSTKLNKTNKQKHNKIIFFSSQTLSYLLKTATDNHISYYSKSDKLINFIYYLWIKKYYLPFKILFQDMALFSTCRLSGYPSCPPGKPSWPPKSPCSTPENLFSPLEKPCWPPGHACWLPEKPCWSPELPCWPPRNLCWLL